jgi:hypothetical protein
MSLKIILNVLQINIPPKMFSFKMLLIFNRYRRCIVIVIALEAILLLPITMNHNICILQDYSGGI